MSTDPDQLRRDIERTQRHLGADVDALTEKVTPSRIVDRRVNRARRSLTSMKGRVMGTASDATNQVSSTASTVADKASSAVSSAGEAVGDAPRAVRRQTQGNPLAAGLIAFGVGWLTASLLPPSRKEQQLAEQAKDLAQEHVVPAVGEAAEQLRDDLREPVEQAVDSVRSTAQDAGGTVMDETRSAARDVRDDTQRAADRAMH